MKLQHMFALFTVQTANLVHCESYPRLPVGKPAFQLPPQLEVDRLNDIFNNEMTQLLEIFLDDWGNDSDFDGSLGTYEDSSEDGSSIVDDGLPQGDTVSSVIDSFHEGENVSAENEYPSLKHNNTIPFSESGRPIVDNNLSLIILRNESSVGSANKEKLESTSNFFSLKRIQKPFVPERPGGYYSAAEGVVMGSSSRVERQAPPNIIYRHTKKPKRCKGDTTNSIFNGNNAFSYVSVMANVISLVLNINNNINNNNNNNNINSNNNIDNNNANFAISSNNANQVNILPVSGGRAMRRGRRRTVENTTLQEHHRTHPASKCANASISLIGDLLEDLMKTLDDIQTKEITSETD